MELGTSNKDHRRIAFNIGGVSCNDEDLGNIVTIKY